MKLRLQDLPVAPAVTSTDLTIIERSNGVTYQTTAGQMNGAGLGTANLSTALVTPTGGSTPVTLANLAASITPALLPTTLPATAGVFWNNNGVLCIS